MNWVFRPRNGGKSYTCIEWVVQDPENRIVVTYNQTAAEMLRRRTEERYPGVCSRNNFVGVDGYLIHRMRGMSPEIAIDELTLVLKSLMGNVVMVTDTP